MAIKGLIQIDKMKASFKNERKKEQQVLLPCIEFPGLKKITFESGIKLESLKGKQQNNSYYMSVIKDNESHK